MHGDKTMMVIAGPGSGKTFVLTKRIAYLINAHHVTPSEILVITFTRAAAAEMQKRFLSLCGGTHPPVAFGTFHAVFYSILKETSICKTGSILSEPEKKKILRDIIKRNKYDVSVHSDMLEEILAEIGRYKNHADIQNDNQHKYYSNDSYVNQYKTHADTVRNEQYNNDTYLSGIKKPTLNFMPQNIDPKLFFQIYRDFKEALEILGKVDFDDMAIKCAELFEKRPDILRRYQEKYRYLLIDEFQDIAPLQYRLVKLLAAPENNLFIVGDDDQSIYGFRGAKPDIMKNFTRDYPEAEVVTLRMNYRSTPQIVNAAGRVISHNKNRFSKDIRAARESGAPVRAEGCETADELENALIGHLLQEKQTGTLSECAVISRTSGIFPVLAEKCRQAGVPCSFREPVKSIYDSEIVSDLSAYLEFSQTPVKDRSRGQFFQFMNRPLRYISRDAVNGTADFGYLMRFYQGRPAMQETVMRLRQDLERIRTMPVFLAIQYIRKSIGYDSYLLEKYRGKSAGERKEETADIMAMADLIQASARGCRTYAEWRDKVEKCRNGNAESPVGRNSGVRNCSERNSSERSDAVRAEAVRNEPASDKPETGVTFMTMHGSKGLEYDKVFILNCNETITPHKKARSEEEIEEERRMFYVAMTRAKKELTLLYVKEPKSAQKESGGTGRKMPPSRFLREMQVKTLP